MSTRHGDTNIKRVQIAKTWGGTPAHQSATGAVYGVVDVGTELGFRAGHGPTTRAIVDRWTKSVSDGQGTHMDISALDERLLLQNYTVRGQYNMKDEMGYYCIYPGQWHDQKHAYVADLLTPYQILRHLLWPRQTTEYQALSVAKKAVASQLVRNTDFTITFSAAAQEIMSAPARAAVNVSWATTASADEQKPVLALDYNDGTSLHAAIIQLVVEKCGLTIRATTQYRHLHIARKGEDEEPDPSSISDASRTNYTYGKEWTRVPDRLEIVGDSNIYQFNEVPLVPKWNTEWNAMALDVAWRMQWIPDQSKTVAEMAVIWEAAGWENYLPSEEQFWSMLAWDYCDLVCFRVYGLPRQTMLEDAGEVNATRDVVNLGGALIALYEEDNLAGTLIDDTERRIKLNCKQQIKAARDLARFGQAWKIVDDDDSTDFSFDEKNLWVIFRERRFEHDDDVVTRNAKGVIISVDIAKIRAALPKLTFAMEREPFVDTFGAGTIHKTMRVGGLKYRFILKDEGDGLTVEVPEDDWAYSQFPWDLADELNGDWIRPTITQRRALIAGKHARDQAVRVLDQEAQINSGSTTRGAVVGRELDPGHSKISSSMSNQGTQESVDEAATQAELGIESPEQRDQRVLAVARPGWLPRETERERDQRLKKAVARNNIRP